ncbi:hypothetical protein GX50_06525 [[Emmonsia] crescens]|uniref:Uncharacterized protein n=1 Tax=[Emmonsia] crescens TaxID=73230 RepID=A0A2B7ZCI1_9EURO|nr:hypothetical protein GX50_06525 [Emmonsia crescens]
MNIEDLIDDPIRHKTVVKGEDSKDEKSLVAKDKDKDKSKDARHKYGVEIFTSKENIEGIEERIALPTRQPEAERMTRFLKPSRGSEESPCGPATGLREELLIQFLFFLRNSFRFYAISPIP